MVGGYKVGHCVDDEWACVDFSKLHLKSGDGGLVSCFVLGALASKHVI